MNKCNISFTRNKNGFLYCQVYFGGTKAVFSTGIKVSPNEWNGKPKGKRAKELQRKMNNIALDIQRDYEYLKTKSEYEGTFVSPKELKDFYLNKMAFTIQKTMKVIDVMIECERHRNNLGQTNTKTYQNNLGLVYRLKICFEALNKPILTFEEIDMDFLTKVFDWLKKSVFRKGILYEKEKRNTYLKRYKQLLERANKYAINCKYTKVIIPNFGKFTDDSRQTPYLTKEELHRIETLDLQYCPELERVRDVFLFGVYTTLNPVDISAFDPKKHLHLKNQVIIIERSKTKNKQVIPILPKVSELLQKYNFKIPLGNLQYHNKHLKTIAKLAGIDTNIKNIQNRSARTTGATYYVNEGVNPFDVSEVLGHTNINITKKHYLHKSPEAIVNSVKSKLFIEPQKKDKNEEIVDKLKEILQAIQQKSPQKEL